MSKHASYPLLAALLALACTARPSDPTDTAGETEGTDGASSGGTDDPTGGASGASATMTAPFDSSSTGGSGGSDSEPGTTTASPGTTTAPDTTGPDTSTTGPGPDPVACDPWIEDCPEGQKCAAYSDDGGSNWNAYKCVPIAPQPGQAGDPCTIEDSPLSGVDTCDEHLMCWGWGDDLEGHCRPMCTGTPGDPTCEDPDDFCALSGDGVLILCLPTCDPLLQDCLDDEVCAPHHDQFVCVLDLSQNAGKLFDPCEFVNVCEPGLVCVDPKLAEECDPNIPGCCLPHCDLSLPNDCPGAGQACLPWFEQDPPPKYADVGVCGVPQ